MSPAAGYLLALSPATSGLSQVTLVQNCLGPLCCMFVQAVLAAEMLFPALNLASDLEQIPRLRKAPLL